MHPQNITYLADHPSPTARMITAQVQVAALDKAIIRHEHEAADVIRFLQRLRENDAIDVDYLVEFEDKLLGLSLSTERLSLARRTAVES